MTFTLLLGVLLIVASTVFGCVITYLKVTTRDYQWREASVFLLLATIGILIGTYLCSVR